MAIRYQISALTATGDTTKTIIDTLTLPASCKAILGVFVYAEAAATLTTAEPITGILELESSDINIVPLQVPLDPVNLLGTAVGYARQIHVWPLNVGTGGKERVSGYITMDLAMTGALKARFGLVLDVQ